MSEVKRFAVPGRYLVAGGKNPGAQDVVLAADYAALEAECDALRTANQRLEGEVARLREALEKLARDETYTGDVARSALSTNGEVGE